MKRSIVLSLLVRVLVLATVFIAGVAAVHAEDIGTAFTYQGHLENGSGPMTGLCNFRIGLWDADAAGSQVGTSPQTASMVDVVGGVFTVSLDYGEGAIDGTARWLEIEVQCPGDGGFVLLAPRVALTAAPHALALRNFRVEPAGPNISDDEGPNIIGGYSGNNVLPDVVGATVFGGGTFASVSIGNVVEASFGTVSGGLDNTAGGFLASTVGGGISNETNGVASTVAGGNENAARSNYSTIPGGQKNQAGGDFSFAAGRRAKVRDAAVTGDADGDNGTFVWADSTNADFTSTGPNQFLIRAGGFVGIGTNAPTDPLTVAGVIKSTTGGFELPDGTIIDAASDLGIGDITAVIPGTGLVGGGTSGSVTLHVTLAGTGAATTSARSDHYHSTLAASDGTPLDAIVVDANGYVGIGTPVPFQRLTVSGEIEINGNSISFDPVNDRLGIGTPSPVRNLDVVGSAGIGGVFWVNSGAADVGIGTPSPTAKLEVAGSLKVDTNTLFVNDSTDRVGIGTTGPSEKLTVAGIVQSTSGGFKFPDSTVQTTAVVDDTISASVAVNPPSISSGSNATLNVTVTGAAVGDAVIANPGANLTLSYSIQYVWVSAANTVTIGFSNQSPVTVDPASSTWEFRIFK